MKITEPGIYDMPAATYHADPVPEGSLSQSRAKALLEEGGPARFHAAETGPRQEKRVWDVGSTIHALILGKGMEQIKELDFPDYRTKAAREARDLAYFDGLTPMLTKDIAAAREVADGTPQHVLDLFTGGQPEASFFWQHESGAWLRGQADYYKPGAGIYDLKTMRDTTTRAINRDVVNFKYYLQAAWYQQGIYELTGELLPYYIVGVEKEPPYLARVMKVSDDYLAIGRAHMAQAIDLYLECTETGVWPGHSADIGLLTPPPWLGNPEADAAIAALENMIGETHD